MKRRQVMSAVRFIAKAIVNLKVIDYDKVPQTGGFLLTTSHISRLDTPFLMLSTPRHDVIPVVAREYQQHAFFRWFLSSLGVIWMSRDESDFGAFREVISYLNKGWIVGIAPEGTRSRTQTLQEGKSGATFLAEKARAPIVPAVVMGSADMVSRLTHFKRMDVTVRFGEAYHLPPLEKDNHKEWLVNSTDEIMCRIAALLPEEKRGFYRDHPRLKALLAAKNQPAQSII